MAALKEANVQQKQIMQNFKIDDMEDLFDDMAEMMEDMEEVNEVMGRNYNVECDENELLGELDELDEELAAEQLGDMGVPAYVPVSSKQQP